MAKVYTTALDAETRRLAGRGAREAFGVPLDRFVDDLTAIGGEAIDEKDLEVLVLAGEAAERVGLPEPAVRVDSARAPVPVDVAALDAETLRLADRGCRELLGRSLDQLVRDLVAGRQALDPDELDGLVLAGRAAEGIDRNDAAAEAPSPEEPGKDK